MFRLFRQYISIRQLFFVVGEGVLIFLAVSLASFIMFGEDVGFMLMMKDIWIKVLVIALVTQLSLYFNDLYEFKTSDRTLEVASRLVQAIGITSIVLAILYYVWPELIIGRWIFFGSVLVLVGFLVSWRILYSAVIRKKMFTEKAIMLGDGQLAMDILKEVNESPDLSYDIRALVTNGNRQAVEKFFGASRIINGFDHICDLAEEEKVDSIIVALDEKRGIFPYRQLLNCKVRGINVIDGESFYERISGRLLVERINPSWLIFSEGFRKSRFVRISKRVVDFLTAGLLLIVFAPIGLVTAIAIKLDSPGPVLFSQDRVGQDGKVFKIYKFRSMRADAEKLTGPVWAMEDDPRITRVGRIIRKLRIDEVPQLWNVFKGDMSFVGPRPERPFFVEQLKKKIPYYNERFTVKPGVTGWAQVKYPYGASEKDALEKLKYDLYYIKNMSIFMDLLVIFQTTKIVLLGRGAR
ncbi:MAG: capsular biosynthesis protein CpsE [Deltaproteobacteria bacterium]|nr:MAG: capsular biosynthesis protein CpsE [Deltaproteobacteria bacterium]